MDWTRGQTIGRGSTATVSIATANRSGHVFAVKSAELSQSKFLKREQKILSTLRCPQIVTYKGCNISAENGKLLYNLFLEYAPDGTLSDAIRKHGGHLDDAVIQSYTREILLGLEYLHGSGIVHCDIKGQNILVTNDGVQIADLGCARQVGEVSCADWATTTPIAGTPVYMAPEVARGEQQGFPADLWALGCTVIEMATGQAPWIDVLDPVSALYRIGFSGDVPEIPSILSNQAKDFLSKCLKRDPVERWSASELLQHDFVKEQNFLLKESHGSNLDTPTSVLNQGLWDSMEDLKTTWNPTHKSSSSSLKERIQQLSEGTMSSVSTMLNWAWDENWVTVRSNDIKEPEMLTSSQECNFLYANELTSSSDTDTIYVGEEFNLVIPSDPTRASGINMCNASFNSSSSRFKENSLMSCKCTKRILCGNQKKRFCFMPFHFLDNLMILRPKLGLEPS